MGLELLTQVLGLSDCVAKDILIREEEIILKIERTGYPYCPRCGQHYLDAPKDRRRQRVEDLSISGKRCFLEIVKRRIDCSCGFKGTEGIEWLERYERVTVRYQNWIYAFCRRMTGIDVAILFGISKHMVYRLDKEGIERELALQKPIRPKRIGVDEISRKKGHRHATIISAPDERKIET